MSHMTMFKTVTVTNPRNVVLQIPSFIAGAEWALKTGDKLEVMYDDRTGEVIIRQAVQRRSNTAEKSDGVVGATKARAN